MTEPTIRWAEPKHPQSNKKTSAREVLLLAGLAGFEPTNAGIKNRCLTTWRQPNFHWHLLLYSIFQKKASTFFKNNKILYILIKNLIKYCIPYKNHLTYDYIFS